MQGFEKKAITLLPNANIIANNKSSVNTKVLSSRNSLILNFLILESILEAMFSYIMRIKFKDKSYQQTDF